MNDKARERIARARLRITEGDYALAREIGAASYPERLGVIADVLGRTSCAASLSPGWGWGLVAEVYCHVTDLPEPAVIRERGPLVDRTPLTFQRREPLEMLAHALGLPDEEGGVAWSIVAGAWAWLLREVEGFRRLEKTTAAEALP